MQGAKQAIRHDHTTSPVSTIYQAESTPLGRERTEYVHTNRPAVSTCIANNAGCSLPARGTSTIMHIKMSPEPISRFDCLFLTLRGYFLRRTQQLHALPAAGRHTPTARQAVIAHLPVPTRSRRLHVPPQFTLLCCHKRVYGHHHNVEQVAHTRFRNAHATSNPDLPTHARRPAPAC